MDFYQRVKNQFVSDNCNRGYGRLVGIDRDALRLLLDDYERLSEKDRVNHIPQGTPQHLESAIKLEYFENNKNGGKIFFLVASILRPLIDENNKRNEVEKRYR